MVPWVKAIMFYRLFVSNTGGCLNFKHYELIMLEA
jgi:hypothetical protein